MSRQNHSIDYVELPMVGAEETKRFYHQAFGWDFADWDPNYVSFTGAWVDGGFNGESDTTVTVPGVLVILYAKDTRSLDQVTMAGGSIVKPTYEFPGGKRFHLHDPNGNEIAVWSER